MNVMKRALLAAALLVVPAAAQAQVDSALSVSRNGVSLFRVDADGEIRTFSTSDYLLRLRAGSPAADRVRIDTAAGFVARGALGFGVIPATGAGERMMWYPYKGSFRAGGVTADQWDDANQGFYSTAFGHNTMAQGIYSFAAGRESQAQQTYGVAMGYLATSNGQSAVALGDHPTAAGSYSVAMGYYANTNGQAAVSLGYRTTADANYSVAIGYRASTNGKTGAIVLADQSALDSLEASVNNQFSLRAAGGIRLYTNSTRTSGVTMAAGGSSWAVVSDRNRKHHLLSVDGEDLLARLRQVPVSTWRYTAEEDRAVRHIGPMAQDWQRAFGFSGDSTTINMSDLDGVNLAGVQALEARTTLQASHIAALQRENAELRARLDAIEGMLRAQASAAPARNP